MLDISPLDGIRSPFGQARGSGPAPAFSPTALYSSGSQGIWLDPRDLATMFSDRAGTTAVTAPGTVVGLRLDKSKGLVLGSELVVNGDFPVNTTGWTAQSATLSVDTGRLKVVTSGSGQGASQVLSGLVAGKTYKISIEVTVGGADWNLLLGLAWAQGQGFASGQKSTSQTYVIVYTCTSAANNVLSLFSYGAGTTYYDNISVRELAGNHAVAPTDAARPIYGVEPKGGRRNLLTWSEDFGNAVWTKAAVTVTANTSVAPDGTTTADLLLPTTANADHYLDVGAGLSIAAVSGTQYSLSTSAKANGYRWLRLAFNSTIMPSANRAAWFDLQTGALGTVQSGVTATITAQANGFYRCSIARDATASATPGQFGFIQVTSADNATAFAGNGTDGILIWGAQLELGSTATAYQRVLSAYDVTEAGVQTCHYVQYDGSDDSMSTAAIDFTATDKMSVFAGVRKLSDNAAGTILAELSSSLAANSGTFYLITSASNGFGFGSKGSASATATTTTPSAPVSAVQTGLSDISGDTAKLRLNGTQVAQDTTDQGAGNFGNYPLFIGRRNNATLPFNGRDYGIIVVGKAASAGEISNTELWLSDKTSEVDVAKSISPNIYTRSGDTILDRANSIIERRTV